MGGSVQVSSKGQGVNNPTGFDSVLDYAYHYVRVGMSIIPLKPMTKEPMIKWKKYQEVLPTSFELDEWFSDNKKNIAIVTGTVSRRLVVIDFDTVESYEKFVKEVEKYPDLKEKLENTWVVATGKGYHVYVRLPDDDLVPRTKIRLAKGVDLKGEGGYVVAPPSTHPNGKQYMFIQGPPTIEEPVVLTEEQWNKLLAILAPRAKEEDKEQKQATSDGRKPDVKLFSRKLDDKTKQKIIEIIKPYYKEGYRHNIVLYLTGMLIKSGYVIDDIKDLVEKLAAVANDEEKDDRLKTVEDQEKRVLNGQKKVYCENEEEEDDEKCLCGRKCLTELLQNQFMEQGLLEEDAYTRAVYTVNQIIDLIKPWRGVYVFAQYKTNHFFVNDPKKGIYLLKYRVEKQVKDNNTVEEVRKPAGRINISPWYIKHVTKYVSSNTMYYTIVFRNPFTKEEYKLSGTLDDILEHTHDLAINRRLFEGAVVAIINKLLARGVGRLKHVEEATGIFYDENNGRPYIVLDSVYTIWVGSRKPDTTKAKKALELLIELRKFYDPKKFDVVINWMAYAPISYVAKKLYGTRQYYLLLHGHRKTGKSTLATIVTDLTYPVKERDEREVPHEASTEYRLAYLMNLTTFPRMTDEVSGLGRHKNLAEMIKRASSNLIARWRGDKHIKYYARSPIIFVSNTKEFINDPALADRIIDIEFGSEDYVFNKPLGERERFKDVYAQYSDLAPWLGIYIADFYIRRWDEIKQLIKKIFDKEDAIRFGQEAWKMLGQELGIIPPWVTQEINFAEQVVEDIGTLFLDYIWEIIAPKLDMVNGDTLATKLAILDEKGELPPGIIVRNGKLYIKYSIIKKFNDKYKVNTTMGGLADVLGVRKVVVRDKLTNKNVKALEIPIAMFADTNTILQVINKRYAYAYKNSDENGRQELVKEIREELVTKYMLPSDVADDIVKRFVRRMSLELGEA